MGLHDFENLRKLLLENEQWPLLYMFKFIVPNNNNRVEKVVEQLPSQGILSYKHTANLKYVAVTCKAYMHSAEAIVDVTRRASAISGVIML